MSAVRENRPKQILQMWQTTIVSRVPPISNYSSIVQNQLRLINTSRLMQIKFAKNHQCQLRLLKLFTLCGIYQLCNRMIVFYHVDLATILANQDSHGITRFVLWQSHIFLNRGDFPEEIQTSPQTDLTTLIKDSQFNTT